MGHAQWSAAGSDPPGKALLVGEPPTALTRLHGRRSEIADIKRALGESRLVTLTGFGGVGKTRIALHVAHELRRSFPGGVGWVELADLREPALLAQTVEDHLGIPEQPGRDPLSVLVEHLRDRRMLIVLDNCEHLLHGIARLTQELLKAAPDLRILASSRQSIGVPGEALLPIPPLPVPAEGASPEPGADAGCPSVALFCERAVGLSPGFRITPENQEAVAELCRKLEGIPLAIELAAAEVRVLSVPELLDRLDPRLQLLRHGVRTLPRRHRTMQATLDWSYDLCTPGERLLWARASVFAGWFSLRGAEAVCSDPRLPREEVFEAIAGLVDKSVLVRTETHGEIRFRLLEPLREHGHAALCQAGDGDLFRDRHLAWMCELSDLACAQWFGPSQEQWCVTFRLARADLRAAVEYALSRPDRREEALRLVGDPWFLWVTLFLREGRHWLDRVLAAAPQPGLRRAKALATVGFVAAGQGDTDAAASYAEECLSLSAAGEHIEVSAYGAQVLGLATSLRSLERAGAVFERALALYESTDAYLDYVVCARVKLGLSLAFRGETDAAVEHLLHCRDLCERAGERWLHSYALTGLALVHEVRGDFEEAVTLVRRAIRTKQVFQDTLGLAMCLDLLAWIKSKTGAPTEAALLLGGASRLWESIGAPLFGAKHWLARRTDAEERGRQSIGGRAWASAFDEGARIPREQLLAVALGEKPSRPEEPSGALTRREQQVAELVADGLSNREIAERLVIAQRTAEGHVEKILAKLGFRSRSQIAAWIVEHGTSALLG
ncbi:ATP-binding protein [Streptomyces canus]|uniref:ATP-binding protein n=1 Tax=Streptomyces canus TaxID=58343 RepID=UPI0032468FFC